MTLREEFYKPKIVNFSMKSTRNVRNTFITYNH